MVIKPNTRVVTEKEDPNYFKNEYLAWEVIGIRDDGSEFIVTTCFGPMSMTAANIFVKYLNEQEQIATTINDDDY